jgi:hypothetical protein
MAGLNFGQVIDYPEKIFPWCAKIFRSKYWNSGTVRPSHRRLHHSEFINHNRPHIRRCTAQPEVNENVSK